MPQLQASLTTVTLAGTIRSAKSGASKRSKRRIRNGDPKGSAARVEKAINNIVDLVSRKGPAYEKWMRAYLKAMDEGKIGRPKGSKNRPKA